MDTQKLIKLIDLIVKDKISETTFPSAETIGFPDKENLEILKLTEIKNDEYVFFVQNEYFVLVKFKILNTEDEKFAFLKVGFANSEMEDLFEHNKMDKTNRHLIESNDNLEVIKNLFQRHLKMITESEGISFTDHINLI